MRYYHKIGKDVIKAGDLMCDAVYLNLLDNYKQWYTHYGGNQRETIVSFNTVILNEVKVKLINYVDLPTISSYKLMSNAISLVTVYFCGDVYDEILETIFQGEN